MFTPTCSISARELHLAVQIFPFIRIYMPVLIVDVDTVQLPVFVFVLPVD